jgi:23S rRNA (pseudouridine1915-N3)-methyltransferase
MAFVQDGFETYQKRLVHYASFHCETLADVKNAGSLTAEKLKEKEADLILNRLNKNDFLVLLDEKGLTLSSEKFAEQLEKWQNHLSGDLVFQIGGAFGFAEAVYQRANYSLSLSAMTFNHQLVRLIFVEQLYRAFTIIKNESYHHA